MIVSFITDNTDIFKSEADCFLNALPSGLQNLQAISIRLALKGSLNSLKKVRDARNSSLVISPATDILNFEIPTRESKVRARFYRRKDSQKYNPVLIYFHGGGWTIGSIDSCSKFCDAVASSGKVNVIALDYSLAPENPFPKALNQCSDAYEWIISHTDAFDTTPDQISVGGDSSGGNLAISTALNVKIKPCSLVVFYPVVKAYNDNSVSWNKYGSGFGLDSQLMNAFNDAYLKFSDTKEFHPLVSPFHAKETELRKLPPILMVCAGHDILRDQGIAFCRKIQALGVPVKRIEFPEAVHLFITVSGQDKAFTESVCLTTDFLQQQ